MFERANRLSCWKAILFWKWTFFFTNVARDVDRAMVTAKVSYRDNKGAVSLIYGKNEQH